MPVVPPSSLAGRQLTLESFDPIVLYVRNRAGHCVLVDRGNRAVPLECSGTGNNVTLLLRALSLALASIMQSCNTVKELGATSRI